MFLVTRNPLLYLIGLGVSLAITAVIYFAIIKPQLDTANQTTVLGSAASAVRNSWTAPSISPFRCSASPRL